MKLYDSSGNAIWNIKDSITLDFTSTDYDTKAECTAAVGMKFSDSDTPFPTKFWSTTSGSWSHSASNGWSPSSTITNQGPGILFPLNRDSNFEIDVVITYDPSLATDQAAYEMGFMNPLQTWLCIARWQAASTSNESRLQFYMREPPHPPTFSEKLVRS